MEDISELPHGPLWDVEFIVSGTLVTLDAIKLLIRPSKLWNTDYCFCGIVSPCLFGGGLTLGGFLLGLGLIRSQHLGHRLRDTLVLSEHVDAW